MTTSGRIGLTLATFAALLLAGCMTDEGQAEFFDQQASLYRVITIGLGLVALIHAMTALRGPASRRMTMLLPALVMGGVALWTGSQASNYSLDAKRHACSALTRQTPNDKAAESCRLVLAEWQTEQERTIVEERQRQRAALERIAH